MKINDLRSRKTGKYTGIVTNEYSWAATSITNVGTFYEADETVGSFRSPKGQTQSSQRFETYTLTKGDGTKKRIRTKEPNEFSLIKTSRNRPYGSLIVTGYGANGDQWYSRKGDLMDYYFADNWTGLQKFATDSVVAGPAINKAYSKANSPELAGFTQIAEMKESLEMLGELGVTAYQFILKMKRNLARHRKTRVSDVDVDDLASLWLSYRYGFLPLYLSIKDIISSKLAKPTYEMVAFDGSADRVNESEYTSNVAIGGHPCTATFTRMDAKSANCRLYVRYKRDANHLGFGAYDLLLTAWEKVTLSFVIDWFIGVGTWLEAYRPGGVLVHWSYCTVVQDFTSSSSATIRKGSSPLLGTPSLNSGTRRLRRSRVVRLTPVTPSPLPAWEFEALKWYRQIDALALSWGIMAGHLRRS